MIVIDEDNTDSYEAYSVQYSDVYADSSVLDEAETVLQAFVRSLQLMFQRIMDSLNELFAMLKAA